MVLGSLPVRPDASAVGTSVPCPQLLLWVLWVQLEGQSGTLSPELKVLVPDAPYAGLELKYSSRQLVSAFLRLEASCKRSVDTAHGSDASACTPVLGAIALGSDCKQ
jgi:hypothetical protein